MDYLSSHSRDFSRGMVTEDICFNIDSQELMLEQVLVDYNSIPVYFICKDHQNQYYVVLCTDIDNEKYIIIKTQINKLIKLLTQKITMRNLILCENEFWSVSAGKKVDDDICERKSIELVDLESLPYHHSYFKVATDAHQNFLNKLENLFFAI